MIDRNQLVEVKIGPANMQHYKDLGHIDIHVGDVLHVPMDELMTSCHLPISIICDKCGDVFYSRYDTVLKFDMLSHENYCQHCRGQETIRNKYGVDSLINVPGVKEKIDSSKTQKYGKDYKQIEVQRMRGVMLERYGTENSCQVKEFNDKRIRTVAERYGGQDFLWSEEARKNRKNTCIERYGFEHPSMNDEIKAKIKDGFRKSSEVPTSKPQMQTFNMLKKIYGDIVHLNYPVCHFDYDIAIIFNDDIKIDIEYDGWYWHQNKGKDRARDEISKSYGWKILRIKGGCELPTEEQLIEAIDKLVGGYSYTQIVLDDWKEVEKA